VKVTKSQLKRLINEELTRDLHEQVIPPAVIKKGSEVGLAILLETIRTEQGREKLASMLVAIPDFIKEYMCNLPSGWMGGSEESENGSQGVRGKLSIAFKMICRFSITAQPAFLILYVLAWFLRLLSDDEARVIIDKSPTIPDQEEAARDSIGGNTLPSPPSSLEDIQVDIAQPSMAESFSAYDLKRLIRSEMHNQLKR